MRFVFAAARFFPYWALGVAMICAELARATRRRARKGVWIYVLVAGVLSFLTLLWFFFRGYARSDEWVRFVFPGS